MDSLLSRMPERFRLALSQTPQDPQWHGEGDVWTHTRNVCEALREDSCYQEAGETARQILEYAALFHDLGKIPCTRKDNGRLISPGHGRVGAEMTRQILWQDLDLCGTPEKLALREAICSLIRDHGLPPRAIDESDTKLQLRRFASDGLLAPGATVEQLCTLARADVLGRECPDQQALLDEIDLCRFAAEADGCLYGPYSFPDAHTAHAWLSGRKIAAEYPFYDDSWGTVVMLSGLPGTGKDTWIRENRPDLPMISLDEIRRELKISPRDNQDPVVSLARERARDYLRKKQAFVWNATNLTPMTRQGQISLFSAYGAATELIYLETTAETQYQRNENRPDAVPERAVRRMLEKLIPPRPLEARTVRWLCV